MATDLRNMNRLIPGANALSALSSLRLTGQALQEAQTPMTSDQLVIILLAAFWAGMNSVISGIKIANEARDRILSDTAAEKLSKHHKKVMLWADYGPMMAGLAAVSIVFGGIVVILPSLADPGKAGALFRKICWIASVVPFSGAAYFLTRGAVEFFQLFDAIRSAKQPLPIGPLSAEASPPSHPPHTAP